MRRLLVVPVLAFVGVGALAGPALGKGPVETATGQVVITGPGLKAPIELEGTLQGFAEPGDGFIPTDSVVLDEHGRLIAGIDLQFTAFLFESGVLSSYEGDHGGWFVLRPDNLRSIGPAYQLRLNLVGEGWTESTTRLLYPFAPDRPVVFTPAVSATQSLGANMLRRSQGLWWSAPPALLEILRSHGLPRIAPTSVPAAPAPLPSAHPQVWVGLWAGLGLLGLLVAGALAGRRRIRMA